MEPDKFKDLVPALLFLLPGFVSAGIVDRLVIRKPKEFFGRLVEALILTAFNLLLFVIARRLLDLAGVYLDRQQFFTPGNLALMTGCSIFIGLVCSFELTNEYLFECARKLRITRKTTSPSTWLETFVHARKFVVVHLEDGRRIYGWPRFYSDDPEERALFLEDASWLSDENVLLNDPPISVFVDKTSGIQLIEFVD